MLCFIICYAAAFLFARASHYIPSGLVLLFGTAVLAAEDMRGSGLPVRLRAVFTLGFAGGQGLSCMKLSRLQTDWEPLTWAVLFLAVMVFRLVFELLKQRSVRVRSSEMNGADSGARAENGACGSLTELKRNRLFLSIAGICLISWAAFFTEAKLLGYVPLFLRGVPHAYSWFHVSGLHYFTVSCALIPALSVVFFETEPGAGHIRKTIVLLCCVCAFLIPVLCVSRSQMILAAMLAGITFATLRGGKVPLFGGACAGAGLLLLYVLLTAARSHSVDYLNEIFEMKYRLPIFVSQPYIYISNNYDNLNCLIRDLHAHSMGIRMLFPVWALTGLKFLYPSLTAWPLYLTKEELTTLTLFYDAWYDFGTAGVVLFSGALGAVSFFLEKRMRETHGPVLHVVFAQMAAYFALSFFTTWFSNPATWFYFAETLAVWLFCRKH